MAADLPDTWHAQPKAHGELEFANPSHEMTFRLGPDGLTLITQSGETFSMRLVEQGYTGDLRKVSAGQLQADGTRVDIRRSDNLTEWYINSPFGLEQGFTLVAPPQRRSASPTAERELILSFELSGSLVAVDGNNGLLLQDSNGETRLSYDHLLAFDAAGHKLPARMILADTRFSLAVDDRDAVYPLTIDPIFAAETKLTASDAAASDQFGFSVAIDGDTAVVGASLDDDGGTDSGSAYVFVRTGTPGTWTEEAKLTASDAAASDRFAFSVGISGDTVIVGAPDDDDAGGSSGSAYVFVEPAGGWADTTETAKLTASDAAALDEFGFSVSISGSTAIVGAHLDDDAGSSSGSAYVFVEPPTGWVTATEDAKLTASDAAGGDEFGFGVAISGNTVLVGAYLDDAAASDSGSAYVFVEPPTGWVTATEDAKLTASDAAAGDWFGWSVAISGDTALVGALFGDSTAGGSGSAYVFVEPPTGWATATEDAELTASDAVGNDWFGWSVAISGDTALVAAPNDDDRGGNSGSAYVFVEPAGGWVDATETAKRTASDGAGADALGGGPANIDRAQAMAISGNTAIVGASLDDDDGTNSGSAYIFAPRVDLALVKNDSADPVTPGNSYDYTLIVTNNDPAGPEGVTATGVSVIDTLPADVQLPSPPAGCVAAGTPTQVTCPLPDLPPAGGTTNVQITVNTTANEQYDVSNTFVVTADQTVNVVSAAGSETEQTIIDNLPSVPAGQAFTIDENFANGNLVGTLVFNDADTNLTIPPAGFTINSGNTGGAFAINAGVEIVVANESALDFETTQNFTLTVTFDDGVSTTVPQTAVQTVAISLNNLNEEDPVVTPGQSFLLNENSANGTEVGTVLATDPDGDVVSPITGFAITGGNTGGAFSIDNAGLITVANEGAVDFETNHPFSLTVTATDGVNTSAPETVVINLADENEAAPVITAPGPLNVDENAVAGTTVGGPLATADADTGPTGDPANRTFAIINGNSLDTFQIDAAGQISVLNPPDFETIQSFSLTVTATDIGGPTTAPLTSAPVTVNIAINALDDELPVITPGQTFDINDGLPTTTVVGTVQATDADSAITGFSITAGNTDNAFNIDAGGVIRINNSAAVAAGPLTFNLTVEATDVGGNTSAAETVTVNVLNQLPPVVTAGQVFNLAENSADGSAVGNVLATDPNGDAITAFSITGGNTGTAFAISNAGALTVANQAVLDFETNPTFTLEITVSDAFGNSAGNVTVNLTNVNEVPAVTPAQVFAVAENTSNGTVVGTVLANDPEGVIANFAIVAGNTGNAFAIGATGVLTVNDTTALNFEVNPSFDLQVTATDGVNTSVAETVTVNLNDIAEDPVVTPGQLFNLDENSANGTAVGTVLATDPQGNGTITGFAITGGNTGNAFAISNTGALTVNDQTVLDFETNPIFDLLVTATDGVNTSVPETVTVNLIDVDEDPVVTPGQQLSISENSPNGTLVGTVVATDLQNDIASFAITGGNTGNAFAINNAGALTVNDQTELDFETNPVFDLTIVVTDLAGNSSDPETVTVNVTDQDEVPVVTSGQIFTLPENSPNATLAGTVAATDPQGAGTIASFAITGGNTGNAFAIGNNGAVTVNDVTALNFEAISVFDLSVTVTDNDGNTSNVETVTVNLVNVNDVAPAVASATFRLNENSANGVAVGTVQATDVDSSITGFDITGGNTGGAFAIDATGVLTVASKDALDFETTPSFTLTVTANDGINTSAPQSVTVNLDDVNETPSVTAGQTFRIDENSDNGTVVGNVAASDPEVAGIFSVTGYAITAGNTDDAFAISGSGVLTVNNSEALDFETNPTFSLSITATDGVNTSPAETVTVALNNVSEDGGGGSDTLALGPWLMVGLFGVAWWRRRHYLGARRT